MERTYKGVIFTNHAIDRMRERGVSQGDAWTTFSHPQQSRFAKAKGAWVFYRTYNRCQIEVVASQNEKKEWVILSVWSKPSQTWSKPSQTWSKPIDSRQPLTNQSFGFLENLVEKVLQKLFGRFRKRT